MRSDQDNVAFQRVLEGCLMGCAVGDSIALPYEGLSRRRVAKMLKAPISHRLLFGNGMVSDDTDHTVFVAQSLMVGRDDVGRFRKALAWRLRLWFATLPAGIGLATLRSIVLLWLGVPPTKSGVRSAGNGPSMRSAIIGCFWHDNAEARRHYVEASTFITHRDPVALAGASAVAEIAARLAGKVWATKPTLEELEACLRGVSAEPGWQEAAAKIRVACESSDPLESASAQFGPRGVSGYTLHSVPFAIVAWYVCFGDFRATVEATIRAGGDTDTMAAIAGAVAGISVGLVGIPKDWVGRLSDAPHGTRYLQKIAAQLVSGQRTAMFRFGLFPRSPLFIAVILSHGVRRLLPPY
jgi:ADP-ribosyl-[dinitrogen reductase] hydrolase